MLELWWTDGGACRTRGWSRPVCERTTCGGVAVEGEREGEWFESEEEEGATRRSGGESRGRDRAVGRGGCSRRGEEEGHTDSDGSFHRTKSS